MYELGPQAVYFDFIHDTNAMLSYYSTCLYAAVAQQTDASGHFEVTIGHV